MRAFAGTPVGGNALPDDSGIQDVRTGHDEGALRVMTATEHRVATGSDQVPRQLLQNYSRSATDNFSFRPILLTQPAEDRWSR